MWGPQAQDQRCRDLRCTATLSRMIARCALVLSLVAGLGVASCGDGAQFPTTPADGGLPPTPDASSPDRTLTIRMDSGENAALVAVQDGDGAWVSLAGDRGVYTTEIVSDRYAVAFACPHSRGGDLVLIHRTTADGFDLLGSDKLWGEFSTCSRTVQVGSVLLEITVRGVPDGSAAFVSTGVNHFPTLTNELLRRNVRKGPIELVGWLSPQDDPSRISKVVRMPEIDLQTDHAVTIDFESQGHTPADFPIAGLPAPGEFAPDRRLPGINVQVSDRGFVWASLATASAATDRDQRAQPGGNAPHPFGGRTFRADEAMTSYQVPPAQLRRPGDRFNVTFEVSSDSLGRQPPCCRPWAPERSGFVGAYESRSTEISMTVPQAVAFELPAAVVASDPTFVRTPHPRPVFAFATPPATGDMLRDYDLVIGIEDPSGTMSGTVTWIAKLSPSWLGTVSELRYEFPDLSQVAGFPAKVLMDDKVPNSWIVNRTERSVGPVNGRSVVRKAFTTGMSCGVGRIKGPPYSCELVSSN